MAAQSPHVSGLVLFLSVDLAGSTAFKAAATTDAALKAGSSAGGADGKSDSPFQKWLPVFTGFYYQFPARLLAAFSSEQRRHAAELGEPPVFWKPIGDELVFTKVLTDQAQALRSIRAFRAAVQEYRKELKRKHSSLDLKASAWLAGFPVGNTQVPIAAAEELGLDLDGEPILVAYRLAKAMQSQGKSARVDYLGPAMDTGFRLGKISTPRRFVLSIDLAFLLTHTNEAESDDPILYRYEGRHELKGVLGNLPYPVFWIDMGASEIEEFEDLQQRRAEIKATDVHRIARVFLDATDGKICKPYITNRAGQSVFGTVPQEHRQILDLIAAEAEKEAERERAALVEAHEPVQEIQPASVAELMPEDNTIKVESPPRD